MEMSSTTPYGDVVTYTGIDRLIDDNSTLCTPELCELSSDRGHQPQTSVRDLVFEELVSLPKGKGIKLKIIEEARKRLQAQATTA